MLKIKNDRTHELINYGFNKNDSGVYIKKYKDNYDIECAILINFIDCKVKNQIVFYIDQIYEESACDEIYDLDIIWDLIQAGLIEKVEG